jgi:uncharacterized protein YggT (Ycf19 family)
VKLNFPIDSTVPLADTVNELLQPIIGPFRATRATIASGDNSTCAFATVIYSVAGDT